MMDPIELEEKATDWLTHIASLTGCWLVGVLLLLLLAGFVGLVVGFAIRAAKWAMGV